MKNKLGFVTPDLQEDWDKVFKQEAAKRKCLRCGTLFKSAFKGNRRCGPCSRLEVTKTPDRFLRCGV